MNLQNFRESYYQIADAIEAIRDNQLGDEYNELLLTMRLALEKTGEKVKKDLGAWD